LAVFCHPGKELPIEQEAEWASRTNFDVSGKKSFPDLQLVYEVFCFKTNYSWDMKFGPSGRQAARRIYRSDSKGVNGEMKKLRIEELHNCGPQRFH
jgi:hypothetical protein